MSIERFGVWRITVSRSPLIRERDGRSLTSQSPKRPVALESFRYNIREARSSLNPVCNRSGDLAVGFTTTPLDALDFRLNEDVSGDREQIVLGQISHFCENIRTLNAGV